MKSPHYLLMVLLVTTPAYATLYGVDDNSQITGGVSRLYVINPSTGAATEVGAIASQVSAGGLAAAPAPAGFPGSDVLLYVSDIFTAQNGLLTTYLGLITDLTTGATSIIGPHSGAAIAVSGLAYKPSTNTMYGAGNSANLVLVNRQTGGTSLIGAFGALINGLAYDPAHDLLFGVSSTSLYLVDQNTGAATLVGPHGVSVNNQVGLEFDTASGVLYFSDTTTDSLYKLNPATGAASLIGYLGANIGALASVPTMNCDVELLYNSSIATVVTHSACRELRAGPALTVEATGSLTLQAGETVVLSNGFRVEPNGTVRVSTCGHSLCSTGAPPNPTCHQCVEMICQADQFCCDTAWDSTCVTKVGTTCGLVCPIAP